MPDANKLRILDYRIRIALAALRSARIAADRSPDSYTLRGEILAEKWLNELLEQRSDLKARVEAEQALHALG